MNTKKEWLMYFYVACFFFLLVFFGNRIMQSLQDEVQRTFMPNPFIPFVRFLIYFGTGVLISLSGFIAEFRKEGKWAINIPCLVLIFLPSLYFSLSYFIYFFPNEFVSKILGYPIRLLLLDKFDTMCFFHIILGNSLLTSFYKKEKPRI